MVDGILAEILRLIRVLDLLQDVVWEMAIGGADDDISIREKFNVSKGRWTL